MADTIVCTKCMGLGSTTSVDSEDNYYEQICPNCGGDGQVFYASEDVF